MNRFAQNHQHLMTLILITWVAQSAAPAWSVILVRDGRAECTIVVPREEQGIVNAARDLQYHLRRMSGAELVRGYRVAVGERMGP